MIEALIMSVVSGGFVGMTAVAAVSYGAWRDARAENAERRAHVDRQGEYIRELQQQLNGTGHHSFGAPTVLASFNSQAARPERPFDKIIEERAYRRIGHEGDTDVYVGLDEDGDVEVAALDKTEDHHHWSGFSMTLEEAHTMIDALMDTVTKARS